MVLFLTHILAVVKNILRSTYCKADYTLTPIFKSHHMASGNFKSKQAAMRKVSLEDSAHLVSQLGGHQVQQREMPKRKGRKL